MNTLLTITPPLSICARPILTLSVPTVALPLVVMVLRSGIDRSIICSHKKILWGNELCGVRPSWNLFVPTFPLGFLTCFIRGCGRTIRRFYRNLNESAVPLCSTGIQLWACYPTVRPKYTSYIKELNICLYHGHQQGDGVSQWESKFQYFTGQGKIKDNIMKYTLNVKWVPIPTSISYQHVLAWVFHFNVLI